MNKMYIKFQPSPPTTILKKVDSLAIEPYLMEDDNKNQIVGGRLFNRAIQNATEFADAFIECLTQNITGRQNSAFFQAKQVIIDTMEEMDMSCPFQDEDIAFYDSYEEAVAVMDEICQVLANGGQFYDLTVERH